MFNLVDLFTVDLDDSQSSIKMKCMPSSYSVVNSAIESIYKVFSQTHVDSRKEGTLNRFVCDFLQDSNGHFHFLKISDFKTDGKPVNTGDWVISSKHKNLEAEKTKQLIKLNKCFAKIICDQTIEGSQRLMDMLQSSCESQDMWYDEDKV